MTSATNNNSNKNKRNKFINNNSRLLFAIIVTTKDLSPKQMLYDMYKMHLAPLLHNSCKYSRFMLIMSNNDMTCEKVMDVRMH